MTHNAYTLSAIQACPLNRLLLWSLFVMFILTKHSQADPAPAWSRALSPQSITFPADHFSHPEFKTEWWYFTGNLVSESGEPMGFQFTLFRQGLRPPGSVKANSAWIPAAFGFGHAAVSLPQRKEFLFGQLLERGSHGSVDFPTFAPDRQAHNEPALLARVGDWSVTLMPDGQFTMKATVPGAEIALVAKPQYAPMLQGDRGLSQKAAGPGNASYYFSIPRLETQGTITTHGKTQSVRGTSWLDREWASNQLAAGQVGWDWFAIQLDDGRDLMIYQMRLANGGRDPYSHGTLRQPDGHIIPISAESYSLKPGKIWTSKTTGGAYPITWELKIPDLNLDLVIEAAQENQELPLSPVAYYEGSIHVHSPRSPTRGIGYMELTGYAQALEVLQSR